MRKFLAITIMAIMALVVPLIFFFLDRFDLEFFEAMLFPLLLLPTYRHRYRHLQHKRKVPRNQLLISFF